MGIQAIGHLRIPCPRFIGREAELLWLRERLEEARRGHGDFIFVAGEAGVGKSRLLAELALQARQAEARILEGKCYLFEAALPYGPLIEAFRGLLHTLGPADAAALLGPQAAEVVKLLPELAGVLPGIQPSPPLGPHEERSRLFESLYLVLRRIAAEAPLILTLEDLHWADPATLEFLHALARRLPQDRWLILTTYRPEELDAADGLRRLRQDLTRERLAQELALTPLGADDVRAMVDAILGPLAPSPQTFSDWLYNYGEGNPFFTEEILRAAVESSNAHLLRLDVTAFETVTVPATVREAILARIEQLPEASRGSLAAAAVLGRTFDLEALQQATGLAGETFRQSLMPLLSLYLLRADRTPIRYAFRHHLIREVMLQAIAPDDRRRLHQRIGEYLERSGAPVQILAHHFREAGDRDRTARYALAAARQAAAVYAHEDAAGCFASALQAMPEAATATRAGAAEGWGDALFHSGRLEEAAAAYALMRQLTEAAGMRRDTIRALRKIGRAQNEQLPGSGTAAWETALGMLAEVDDPVEEAMIREQASKVASITGQFDRGVAEAEAAVAAAFRAKDPAAQSRAYKSLALNLYFQGRRERVREYLQRALDLAVEAGDLEAELKALNDIGNVAMIEGEFAQARAALERGAGLVEKIGELPTLLLPVDSLAELSFYEGRWDEAERLWRRMTTLLGERFGRAWPFAISAALLARVRFLRGDREEAAALLDEAEGAAQAASNVASLGLTDSVRAQLALQVGDAQGARNLLDRALAREGVDALIVTRSRLLQVESLIALGRLPDAEVQLQATIEHGVVPLDAPAVHRLRGRIAAQLGRLDEAVEASRLGLDELTRARQPYKEALLRYELGVWLLRRGGRGDRKAAREHLLSAASIFEGLGAGEDAARARQALRRISGRKPSGLDLTEREREVVVLLSQGLSNAAIAARLYISERTVEVHVSHILGKLGIETRTQAAAWAMKHLVR